MYNKILYAWTEQMFADFVTPAGPWLIDGQIGPENPGDVRPVVVEAAVAAAVVVEMVVAVVYLSSQ